MLSQHVVAPLKRQIVEIAESNKAVEKQLRQELEHTTTSLNEAKRRITTLEKDMENKVSQNQLIAKVNDNNNNNNDNNNNNNKHAYAV
jgi:predicted oxidoreductase (fatty acid repression mutant protein)